MVKRLRRRKWSALLNSRTSGHFDSLSFIKSSDILVEGAGPRYPIDLLPRCGNQIHSSATGCACTFTWAADSSNVISYDSRASSPADIFFEAPYQADTSDIEVSANGSVVTPSGNDYPVVTHAYDALRQRATNREQYGASTTQSLDFACHRTAVMSIAEPSPAILLLPQQR